MGETAVIRDAEALIALWVPRLGLEAWDISVKESETPSPDDADRPFATRAEVLCDPTYEEARITVFPAFAEISEAQREAVIVHELAHCLMEAQFDLTTALLDGKHVTADEATRTNEYWTERVAKVLIRAWGHDRI